MRLSDGTERSDSEEPIFHRFLRETARRLVDAEIDRLKWENFQLKEKLTKVRPKTMAAKGGR